MIIIKTKIKTFIKTTIIKIGKQKIKFKNNLFSWMIKSKIIDSEEIIKAVMFEYEKDAYIKLRMLVARKMKYLKLKYRFKLFLERLTNA